MCIAGKENIMNAPRTNHYAWEVMSSGEFEGLFNVTPSHTTPKPQPKDLTSEEIWLMCGLNKFTIAEHEQTVRPTNATIAHSMR